MGSSRDVVEDPRIARTRRDVVSAATDLLLTRGWSGVAHAAVAAQAGYSKATVYAHWPTQLDLVRASVSQICDASTHEAPTGDLRDDVVRELSGFADALAEGQLGRVLGGVLERAGTDPAVDQIRQQLCDEGSRTLQGILEAHLPSADVEPVLAMLTGAVLIRVTIQSLPADRGFIDDVVDRTLRAPLAGIDARP